MDDQRRVAMVESKTWDTIAITNPAELWRFQLGNHLDSASLELDESAGILSYEEYHPYGSTAFHTAKSGAEVSTKRYRYTGKERDEEMGLYYHGARYYVAWLGRWTAADPAGLVDGLNLYRYSRDNPVNFSDPGGTESKRATNEEFHATASNKQIGLLTDKELIRQFKSQTNAEVRATVSGATGLFQERARQAAGIAGRDLRDPGSLGPIDDKRLMELEQEQAAAQAALDDALQERMSLPIRIDIGPPIEGGDPEYYRKRAKDFLRRNPGLAPPS